MRRLLCALLIFAPTAAHAGSVTLDFGNPLSLSTTAAQDAAIQRLVDDVNAARAAETPPKAAITKEQYLRAILVEAVKSYVREASKKNATDACATFAGLSQAKQDAIKAELGGKAPCE